MTASVRLLVVEDDVMQSELVERALGRDGFEVRAAATLGEISRVVSGWAPELVLIDVNLPDTTSGQAVALLRELAPTAKLVLYSAWEESKLRTLSRELGTEGFISKSESVFSIGGRLRELYR